MREKTSNWKYYSHVFHSVNKLESENSEMFFVIGLGLGDAKDITVKGLEIIKKCDRVFLEAYTSILTCGHEALVSDK